MALLPSDVAALCAGISMSRMVTAVTTVWRSVAIQGELFCASIVATSVWRFWNGVMLTMLERDQDDTRRSSHNPFGCCPVSFAIKVQVEEEDTA